MNKSLLLMNVLLAGALLASCSGANGPGTPITKSAIKMIEILNGEA